MAKVKFGNFHLMGTSWEKFSGFSRSFCSNLVEFGVLGVTKSNLGSFRVFRAWLTPFLSFLTNQITDFNLK